MPSTYRDDRIDIDADRIRIRALFSEREIPLSKVRGVRLIELGISRYRLVGIGPEHPRTWFIADPKRRHRKQALELDVGKRFLVGVTPDDPEAALEVLGQHLRC